MERTEALGKRAVWTMENPQLPGYVNRRSDLSRWASGRKSLPRQPQLNCWEVVFAGAIKAGALTKKQVRSMYAEAGKAGKEAFFCDIPRLRRLGIRVKAAIKGTGPLIEGMDDATYARATRGHQTYLRTLVEQLGPRQRGRRSLGKAREGDVVVFSTPGDPVSHVALCLKQSAGAKTHQVLSFTDRGMERTTAEAVQQIYGDTFGRCMISLVRPDWSAPQRAGQHKPRKAKRWLGNLFDAVGRAPR